MRGVERAGGVLENNLPLPTQADKCRASGAGDSLALEAHFARARVLQADERSPERALSTAAFAYEPDRGAATDRQIHPIDGAQEPLPRKLVVPDEADGLDQRFAHEALQQATSWSSAKDRSGGVSRQTPTANGQRGAKRQPEAP